MIDMAACETNRNCKGFVFESPLIAWSYDKWHLKYMTVNSRCLKLQLTNTLSARPKNSDYPWSGDWSFPCQSILLTRTFLMVLHSQMSNSRTQIPCVNIIILMGFTARSNYRTTSTCLIVSWLPFPALHTKPRLWLLYFALTFKNLNSLIVWAQQNEDGRGEKKINDLLWRCTW